MPNDRTSAEYQQWKQDVRKRDGNVCRRCGFGTNLEVHHIKPRVKHPEFEIEPDNGLTLCGNCHSLLLGREETTDLLKFIKEPLYSRDEQIVEELMAMMAEQLKALNDKFTDSKRNKAAMLTEADEFTEPKHIQAEMLRLEAEEKLREAERLRREADDAVKKRQLEIERKRRREEEQKRQHEAEKQQQRNTEEKLRSTKQQASIRAFQGGKGEHLSDNCASVQVKKKKNLGKPKNSHRKHLKQTNRAGTMQRSNTRGMREYRREVGRNQSKVKAARPRRTDATVSKQDAAALEQLNLEQLKLRQLKLRAEKGNAQAQLSLGIKYRRSKNDGEAAKWYRKAAEQGNATAQYNLGRMYAKGMGVLQNDEEAVKWYRRAARQGNTAARAALLLLSR